MRRSDDGLTTRNGTPVEIESDLLKRPLWATDFTRFSFRPRNDAALIFPYRVSAESYSVIPENELREGWPQAYAYLLSNKARLERRKQYREWYGFSAPRNLDVHQNAHLVVPLLADKGLAAPLVADSSAYCLMAGGGFSLRLRSADTLGDPLYVLGLVNSKLLFWYLRLISNRFRGGWITCTKQYFGQLPIRVPAVASTSERARHDALVALVGRRVSLASRVDSITTPAESASLDREVQATERQIDNLVYEIYEVSEADVALVEDRRT